MRNHQDVVTQIEETLPPFVEGRDRPFHFEPDGTLVYDRADGPEAAEIDWEPPRPIDGFEADPEDPWRLRPLWGHCGARMHTAVRFTACGCLGLITRCTEPGVHFLSRVSYEMCQQCPLAAKESQEETDHAV